MYLVVGHNSAHEPVSLGLCSVNHVSSENHLHRLGLSNRPDESLRASAARNDAQCDFWLPELGTFRCDDHVAAHGQFTTPTQCIA